MVVAHKKHMVKHIQMVLAPSPGITIKFINGDMSDKGVEGP
jgi:hypothetical protein